MFFSAVYSERLLHYLLIIESVVLVLFIGYAIGWKFISARTKSIGPGCGKCRYPVRGNDGNQCPECGADYRKVGVCQPKILIPLLFSLAIWSLAIDPLVWAMTPVVEYFCPWTVSGWMKISLAGSDCPKMALTVYVNEFPLSNVPSNLIAVQPGNVHVYDDRGRLADKMQLEVQRIGGDTVSLDETQSPMTETSVTAWWKSSINDRKVDHESVVDLMTIINALRRNQNHFETQKLKWAGVDLSQTAKNSEPEWYYLSTIWFWRVMYGAGIAGILFFAFRPTRFKLIRPIEPWNEATLWRVRRVYWSSLFVVCAVAVGLAVHIRMSPRLNGAFVWDSYEDMHKYYLDAFVQSRGFGESRVWSNDQWDEGRRFSIGYREYAIRRLELIGLLKHDKPVVYLNQTSANPNPYGKTAWKNPVQDRLADSSTRPLTDIEIDALTKIKTGAMLVEHPELPRPIMIGALRADQQNCIECHHVEKGTLMGAFVYELDSNVQSNFPDDAGKPY
jgi:hypothetical protein